VTQNKIYRSTTNGGPYAEIASIGANTSYTDTQVTGGTTYYYVVTAVSGNGESALSNQDSGTPK
jgi:fibronectin type 3 domain-containing protein